ncbi:MAG: hypothetical protein WC606_04410 [Candidatus Absconditabacterales bacterium]
MNIIESWLRISDPSIKDQRLKINGEEGKYQEAEKQRGESADRIITPTKEYIIENIAGLLQQNIEPGYSKLATDLYQIQKNDEKLLLEIFGKNDLIGPGKTYQVHNGGIRYSSDTKESGITDNQRRKFVQPSSKFITNDINHFKPHNKHFSENSTKIYWHDWGICDKGGKTERQVHALQDSNFLVYNDIVFFATEEVKGAMVVDDYYSIIKLDRTEIIKDSNGVMFSGACKLKIKHPEHCEQVMDDFLFDGECVYLALLNQVANITELYKFTPGETISKGENSIYKIGNKSFTYDNTMYMGIKLI